MGIRIYRDSWKNLVVGILFVLVPLFVFSVPALGHLFTGEPMMLRNRDSWTTHVASKLEVTTLVVMPLLLSALGVLLMSIWKKGLIQTDKDSIRKYDSGGRVRFSAKWSELTRVSKNQDRNGAVLYAVYSDQRRMDFCTSKGQFNDLVAEIKQKAKHLDFTPWQYAHLFYLPYFRLIPFTEGPNRMRSTNPHSSASRYASAFTGSPRTAARMDRSSNSWPIFGTKW